MRFLQTNINSCARTYSLKLNPNVSYPLQLRPFLNEISNLVQSKIKEVTIVQNNKTTFVFCFALHVTFTFQAFLVPTSLGKLLPCIFRFD